MSYYYPFGANRATTIQNISYSFAAVSASTPRTTLITALTASFVSSVITPPTAGLSGSGKNAESCSLSAPVGVDGPSGSRGPKGIDLLICPDNTIPCPGLNTSLSTHINPNVPSGSQYSIVCLQIPPGCSAAQVGCPAYLPIAYPTIPIP